MKKKLLLALLLATVSVGLTHAARMKAGKKRVAAQQIEEKKTPEEILKLLSKARDIDKIILYSNKLLGATPKFWKKRKNKKAFKKILVKAGNMALEEIKGHFDVIDAFIEFEMVLAHARVYARKTTAERKRIRKEADVDRKPEINEVFDDIDNLTWKFLQLANNALTKEVFDKKGDIKFFIKLLKKIFSQHVKQFKLSYYTNADIYILSKAIKEPGYLYLSRKTAETRLVFETIEEDIKEFKRKMKWKEKDDKRLKKITKFFEDLEDEILEVYYKYVMKKGP